MNDTLSKEGSIGFWGVVAIGVGGMVGGGIFAVLGLAVCLAGGGTPIAFAVAGLVAALTAYSYAKLSVRFPSEGGTVEFLNQAYGPGQITGSLNVLLWISYLVMLSLYSFACGSYGASFFPVAAQPFWKHVILSSIILVFTALNVGGATFVGRAEKYIVAVKIAILLLFVASGYWFVEYQRLAPSTWAEPLKLIAGGMIIFVAYEGFELIANTAQDVKNPKKTLPGAYYAAVGFVIVLYIVVAMVTVGNLPLDKIVAAKDYALAAAAEPFLGTFGFVLIAIAALLATSSAINATLYGAARISYIIAKDGELPAELEKKVWRRPIEGLLITCGLSLLVANFFDLSSIATMGSAGFLLIFAAVNASNARLYIKTDSKRWISTAGAGLCIFALIALVWQTAETAPKSILVLAVMFCSAFVIEAVYRGFTHRQLKPIITKGGPGHN